MVCGILMLAAPAIAGLFEDPHAVTPIRLLALVPLIASLASPRLADLIREVADMYQPIAEDKRIDLLIHSPHELNVHGDRDLLIEAIANLVDNAVKFTPAGGQVEIGLFRGNGENIVRVKDTGSGISEHECDAVRADG